MIINNVIFEFGRKLKFRVSINYTYLLIIMVVFVRTDKYITIYLKNCLFRLLLVKSDKNTYEKNFPNSWKSERRNNLFYFSKLAETSEDLVWVVYEVNHAEVADVHNILYVDCPNLVFPSLNYTEAFLFKQTNSLCSQDLFRGRKPKKVQTDFLLSQRPCK